MVNDSVFKISLLWPDEESYNIWRSRDYPLKDDLVKDTRLVQICNAIQVNNNSKILCDLLSKVNSEERTVKYRSDFLHDIISYPWIQELFRVIRYIVSLVKDEETARFDRSKITYVYLWYLQKLISVYEFCDILYINVKRNTGNSENSYSEVTHKLLKIAENLLFEAENQKLSLEVKELINDFSKYQHLKLFINLRRYSGYFTVAENKEYNLFSKIIGQEEVNKKNNLVKPGVLTFPLYDGIIDALEKADPDIFQRLKNVGKKVEKLDYIYKTFIDINNDLDFYESALKLKGLMKSLKLPCCLPLIEHDSETCRTELNEFYDLTMALLMKEEGKYTDCSIVTNDVNLSESKRIAIITGPNQGGKTTWLRAVTLCQVLFQAGLFVPASHARLIVRDYIFTHFPAEEKHILLKGRLREESDRLKIIFKHVTEKSMVIMNESFSSTNAIDGINILSDVMKALRTVGATAALATHLHELIDEIDAINQHTAPGEVIHMVACTEADLSCNKEATGSGRTYKILPSIKGSGSYAMDIALICGADPQSLEARIIERLNILNREDGV